MSKPSVRKNNSLVNFSLSQGGLYQKMTAELIRGLSSGVNKSRDIRVVSGTSSGPVSVALTNTPPITFQPFDLGSSEVNKAQESQDLFESKYADDIANVNATVPAMTPVVTPVVVDSSTTRETTVVTGLEESSTDLEESKSNIDINNIDNNAFNIEDFKKLIRYKDVLEKQLQDLQASEMKLRLQLNENTSERQNVHMEDIKVLNDVQNLRREKELLEKRIKEYQELDFRQRQEKLKFLSQNM